MTTKPMTPKAPKTPTKRRATAAQIAKPVAADLAADASRDASGDAGVVTATDMRLKDLVDHVTKTSGLKKKDVRIVVQATLARIGAALQKGDSMALAGLGKLRVVRAAPGAGGAMTLKLRMATPGAKPASAASAPADDQDDD